MQQSKQSISPLEKLKTQLAAGCVPPGMALTESSAALEAITQLEAQLAEAQYQITVEGSVADAHMKATEQLGNELVEAQAGAERYRSALKKALPILGGEADRREYAHRSPDDTDPYWTEARELFNEIHAALRGDGGTGEGEKP